jgi:hypothetical protein
VAGGTAKRIFKGLAGPDMTLGTEAVSQVGARCESSDLVVGEDDAMTWGLVFDLDTMAFQAPSARASKAGARDDRGAGTQARHRASRTASTIVGAS